MITMFNAMNRSLIRTGIIALLVAASALLGACSALRFGYNQADELAYWWLDGYLDFNEGQTPRVREALAQWHAWHRRTQLPDYSALLARVRTEVSSPITPERMCQWWSDVRSRIDVSFERAVPAAAELMLTVTPEQVRHVERRYAKSNDEFRADYLQADPAERRRESIRRAVERAESFYGRLEEAQRERVAKAVVESPFDADLWFSERKLRQQEALHILRRLRSEGASGDQAQAALRAYYDHAMRSPRPAYLRYSQNLTQYNCVWAANLHNAATPAQLAVLVGKLKGWEADLRSLVAGTAP
jgi:Family of unknown function (DUF6279)